MRWCEENGVDYVFGLPGNTALHADPVIATEADVCAADRATRKLVELRRDAEIRYAAKTWGKDKRRLVAGIEASSLGLDVRFVTTSLTRGPRRIYLRHALLCPWPGREPDQAPQIPAQERPDVLPFRQCQPDADHPAYRRLLADVGRPSGYAGDQPASECRVRNRPPALTQDRRAHRRNR